MVVQTRYKCSNSSRIWRSLEVLILARSNRSTDLKTKRQALVPASSDKSTFTFNAKTTAQVKPRQVFSTSTSSANSRPKSLSIFAQKSSSQLKQSCMLSPSKTTNQMSALVITLNWPLQASSWSFWAQLDNLNKSMLFQEARVHRANHLQIATKRLRIQVLWSKGEVPVLTKISRIATVFTAQKRTQMEAWWLHCWLTIESSRKLPNSTCQESICLLQTKLRERSIWICSIKRHFWARRPKSCNTLACLVSITTWEKLVQVAITNLAETRSTTWWTLTILKSRITSACRVLLLIHNLSHSWL